MLKLKNKYHSLLKGILILFVTLFCISCKDFQKINLSAIDGFKMNKISPEGMEAQVNVKIKNPNAIGFTIFRSSCDVYYGEKYLGKARLSKKVRIPGNSDEKYTFVLKGDFKNISFADISSLIGGKQQNIQLKGYIKAGKFFYKKKFPIDKKQRLSLNGR